MQVRVEVPCQEEQAGRAAKVVLRRDGMAQSLLLQVRTVEPLKMDLTDLVQALQSLLPEKQILVVDREALFQPESPFARNGEEILTE